MKYLKYLEFGVKSSRKVKGKKFSPLTLNPYRVKIESFEY